MRVFIEFFFYESQYTQTQTLINHSMHACTLTPCIVLARSVSEQTALIILRSNQLIFPYVKKSGIDLLQIYRPSTTATLFQKSRWKSQHNSSSSFAINWWCVVRNEARNLTFVKVRDWVGWKWRRHACITISCVHPIQPVGNLSRRRTICMLACFTARWLFFPRKKQS